MLRIPQVKDGDWATVRQALQKLTSYVLGHESEPTFANMTLSDLEVNRLITTDADGKLEVIDVDSLPSSVIKGKVLRLSTDNCLYFGKEI